MGYTSYEAIKDLMIFKIEYIYLKLAIMGMFTFYTMQTIIAGLNVLFFSKDVETLLPLPIWEIFTRKKRSSAEAKLPINQSITNYLSLSLLCCCKSSDNSLCVCNISTCSYILHCCNSLVELLLLVVCNAQQVVDIATTLVCSLCCKS